MPLLPLNANFSTKYFAVGKVYTEKGGMNRIYHRFRKSQPEGKRIMPETRFTEFPTLSVDPKVGVSQSVPETDV